MRLTVAFHDDWSIGSGAKELLYDESLKLSEEETLGTKPYAALG
jgi:hypothetical protein